MAGLQKVFVVVNSFPEKQLLRDSPMMYETKIFSDLNSKEQTGIARSNTGSFQFSCPM